MTIQSPLRVLVFCSDQTLLHMLAVLFQRQGWNVTTTADGERALELLRAGFPDAFVIDQLVQSAQPDVLEWIATRHAAWLGHVVVLTDASRRMRVELMKFHAPLRTIDKPFDIADLVEDVEWCAAADRALSPQSGTVQESAS